MDKLKQHLSDNQNDMNEVFQLPEGHKARFEHKLASRKSGSVIIRRLVLAGISAAALVALYFSVFKSTPASEEVENPPQLSDVSTEMEQMEIFFTERLSNNKLPAVNEDPVLTRQMALLLELENDYQNLRLALQKNFGNQHVIDAMIKNYQMRIRIMEQMKKYNELKNKLINTTSNENHS